MKLTERQRKILSMIGNCHSGCGLSVEAFSWGPVKRLIRKQAIVKSGSRSSVVFYKITPEGRQALKGGE